MAKSASGRRRRKQQQQQQQDLTAWDRFWVWIKVNEKMMWVLLLLLIAPAFAFTGATSRYFNQKGNTTPACKVFGETITRADLVEVQSVILSVNQSRGYFGAFGEGRPLGPEDFMLLEHEAERLGIVVSDVELGRAIRLIYQSKRARQDAALAAPQGNQTAFGAAYRARFEELRENDAWDAEDWRRMLTTENRNAVPITHPRVFEDALRRYMTAERVIDYVQKSVQVNEDEVREAFQRENKFRKLSFFEVAPDESKQEEVAAALGDEEIEKYFDDNLESFNSPIAKVKVDYVFVPYDAFKDVEISEEDIQKEYEAVRGTKYRRGLVDEEVDSFNLVSKEEEKAREAKLYRPLEEVRDEIVETVTEKKRLQAARLLANGLKNRIFPAGQEDDGSAKSAVELETLKKEHDFLEIGTSPFMASWEIDSKFKDYSSVALTTLARDIIANAQATSEADQKPIVLPKSHVETSNKKGFVIYSNLRQLPPGIPEFEEIKEEARERLAKERALDALEEELDAVVSAIRSDEKTFEDAATEREAKVHETAFIKSQRSYGASDDGIKLPVEDTESDDTEDADAEGDDEPKLESFKGDAVVRAEGFLITERGSEGVTLARDDANTAIYVVRFDDELDPDPKDFAKKRESIENQLLRDRRAVYFREWLAGVYARGFARIGQPAAENRSDTDEA